MVVKCSWCGKTISTDDEETGVSDLDLVSHGICSKCFLKEKLAIQKYFGEFREQTA
jgi:hypothetical protein